MRGTLSARAIVAKDKTASGRKSATHLDCGEDGDSHITAIICVSTPSWLLKPPAKYVIPPFPLPVMYGTFRMWLNICPLVNMRTMIRLNAAHKFRFCTMGNAYG